ncbi:MAG: DUF3098 domain-containing protein [Candidatus Kapabacteria bacterium]|nr:DUF3098 domain-containing protein [Candidatus Kapabacteria bacterium]MDW8011910.1 DUF3098 domain-containing protein [Bacteroidota bacterium]
MAKARRPTPSTARGVQWSYPLERRNWLIIGVGIALIVLGYLLMSVGIFTRYDHPLAMVVAPIVLVIAYLVVIPYGILKRWSKPPSASQ